MKNEHSIDLTKTSGLVSWIHPDGSTRVVYNPWGNRDEAKNMHAHEHTRWAKHIHENWRFQRIQDPASFNWGGRDVFIVGRGKSLEESLPLLKKKGRGPALWLNHSFTRGREALQPQDFVICIDDNMLGQIEGEDVSGLNLICMPGVSGELLGMGWKGVYGFTFWPKAHLNDWMGELFPEYSPDKKPLFPRVNECTTVSVSAMHLAHKNGAKNICLVAQDFTTEEGNLVKDRHGIECKTIPVYAQDAMSVNCMASIINMMSKRKVINCTENGLLGSNVLPYACAEGLNKIANENPSFPIDQVCNHFDSIKREPLSKYL